MADKKVEALKIVEDIVEELPLTKADHEKWFDANIHKYKTLAATVAATLKSTLEGHEISYIDIPFREKNKKSFLKKIEDKNKSKEYTPEHMTDLAGIRIITLIEADVKKVGDLIEKLFSVHQKDSVNKSESLGDNKVGYRSVHFVCDIGEARESLLEWESLKGLCFEIQVRTALEHAWAEIEHDRGYKLGGKLPSHLIRRFSLLSGLLESADMEFNRLTVEIEEYAKSLGNKIDKNNLKVELTTVGIRTLIKNKYSTLDYQMSNDTTISKVIEELENFGIHDLDDLDKKISIAVEYILEENETTSEIGILRAAMLFSDMTKYFQLSWSNSREKWHSISESRISSLVKHYNDPDITEKLSFIGILPYQNHSFIFSPLHNDV